VTLRERIAEWRERRKVPGPACISTQVYERCADELTPIAEALEAVVRDIPHGELPHSHACPRCRLERIVGKA
jgi:hypothetical protein